MALFLCLRQLIIGRIRMYFECDELIFLSVIRIVLMLSRMHLGTIEHSLLARLLRPIERKIFLLKGKECGYYYLRLAYSHFLPRRIFTLCRSLFRHVERLVLVLFLIFPTRPYKHGKGGPVPLLTYALVCSLKQRGLKLGASPFTHLESLSGNE